MTRAGAEAKVGVRAQASKMALRIRCKSSSESLGTPVIAIGVIVIRGFVPKSLVSCLKNSDSRGREESERVIKGVMEGHSWQK